MFFFIFKSKSGEKSTDPLCEKMGKSISSRLCENITVLFEVGPWNYHVPYFNSIPWISCKLSGPNNCLKLIYTYIYVYVCIFNEECLETLIRAAWLQSSLHITGLHSYQTDASPFFSFSWHFHFLCIFWGLSSDVFWLLRLQTIPKWGLEMKLYLSIKLLSLSSTASTLSNGLFIEFETVFILDLV